MTPFVQRASKQFDRSATPPYDLPASFHLADKNALDPRRDLGIALVESLLVKLNDILQVDAEDADLKPVVQTRWSGGTTGILRLLIDGHLKNVYCKSDVIRLDDLLVDHCELRQVPREIINDPVGNDDVDEGLIDATAARRRLKTTKSVVDAIIAAGIVPHVLKENRHQGRGNFRVWVRTADIDQFAREYVALDELAVERGVEPMMLLT